MSTGEPAPGSAPVAGPARGVTVLAQDEFSLSSTVGGVRGVLEALAPGVVFVVVYLLTFELTPTLVASLGVALVAVLVRLVQRTPVTQAFSGVLGVVIGVVWAWRSGDARDYFAFGLWTNGAYLVACLISVAVRWPLVGVVVEAVRAGFGTAQTPGERAQADTPSGTSGTAPAAAETENPFAGFSRWRLDRALLRRYQIATGVWATLFAVRLGVQLPLYLKDEAEGIGWLGTARLAMGVPLWALTMWLTWVLVRRSSAAPELPRPPRAP